MRLLFGVLILAVISTATLATIVRPLSPDVITARNADQVRLLHIIDEDVPLGPATYNPDGSRIAAIAQPDALNIYDADGAVLLRVNDEQVRTLSFVYYSPDGRLIATVGTNGQFHVWDSATGALLCVHVIGGWNGSFPAFSTDSRTLAVTEYTLNAVRLLDIETCTYHPDLTPSSNFAPPTSTTSLDFSPDGQHLVAGNSKGELQVWDVRRQHVVWGQSIGGFIYRAEYSPDGEVVLVIAMGNIAVWDADSGRELLHIGDSNSLLYFAPTGSELYFKQGRRLMRWDGNLRGSPRLVTDSLAVTRLSIIAASPYPATTIAVLTRWGIFYVLDGRHGDILATSHATMLTTTGGDYDTTSISFNAAGTRILTTNSNGDIAIWGIE